MATVAEIEQARKLVESLKQRQAKIDWELEQLGRDPTKSLADMQDQLARMRAEIQSQERNWDSEYGKFVEQYGERLELPPEDD